MTTLIKDQFTLVACYFECHSVMSYSKMKRPVFCGMTAASVTLNIVEIQSAASGLVDDIFE